MSNKEPKNDINKQGFRLLDYIKNWKLYKKNKNGDVIILLKNQKRKT